MKVFARMQLVEGSCTGGLTMDMAHLLPRAMLSASHTEHN